MTDRLWLDEAHKATGNHSYAKVVKFLMAKNPHFRVLALTATPGSTPAAVQAVVDSLHISHIEIRDEESFDLRPYIFDKASQYLLLSSMIAYRCSISTGNQASCNPYDREHIKNTSPLSKTHGGADIICGC